MSKPRGHATISNRHTSRRDDRYVEQLTAPRGRLREYLRALSSLHAEGGLALSRLDPLSKKQRLQGTIFGRATNGLQAARLLLQDGHWVFAAPIVRHLFETVVDVEHLNTIEENAAIDQFWAFSELQHLIRQRAELRYISGTMQISSESNDLIMIEEQLKDARFDQFKGRGAPRADGMPRWRTHWTGKNIRALAEASTNPHRAAQYELLYPILSEHGHGTPGSYFEELTLAYSPNWSASATASSDRHVLELGMVQTLLYMELWTLLDAIPKASANAIAAEIKVRTTSQEALIRLGPPEVAEMLNEIRKRGQT